MVTCRASARPSSSCTELSPRRSRTSSEQGFASRSPVASGFIPPPRRLPQLRLPALRSRSTSPSPASGGAFVAWVAVMIFLELEYLNRSGLLPARGFGTVLAPAGNQPLGYAAVTADGVDIARERRFQASRPINISPRTRSCSSLSSSPSTLPRRFDRPTGQRALACRIPGSLLSACRMYVCHRCTRACRVVAVAPEVTACLPAFRQVHVRVAPTLGWKALTRQQGQGQ